MAVYVVLVVLATNLSALTEKDWSYWYILYIESASARAFHVNSICPLPPLAVNPCIGGGAGDLPKPFSYAPRSGLVPMGAGLSFPVISYSGALRAIYVSQFAVPFPKARDVPDKEKSPLAGSVNPGSTS